MRRLLKRVLIVLGGLIGLIVIAGVVLTLIGNARLSKTYNIQVESVTIPTDAASVERGKRSAMLLCTGCHGDDLAGTAFFDNPAFGSINAKNLTRGQGGIGTTYADVDWIRTLRHGVRPDGTSAFIMPANNFYFLSDGDLADLIAYLKSAPPVDKEWRPVSLGLMGKILVGLGMFDSNFSAGKIDHSAPRPAAPAPGVTAAYGDYLVHIHGCRTCHGEQLSGGKDPDPTITALGPNLTPGGELAGWNDSDFTKTLRTGVTPSGHSLAKFMPWQTFSKLSDDELKAVFLYLQSLPRLAATTH